METPDRVHCRWHPFEKIWILNSPQRINRKWLGKKGASQPTLAAYDPDCPFCPGNTREDGGVNPKDATAYPFAFANATPAILPPDDGDVSVETQNRSGRSLFRAQAIYGVSRIVNFHPQHNLTFSLMSAKECERVVKFWQKEYQELGELPYVSTVNIFENNGFGSSLSHPHNQIMCSSEIPPYLAQILEALREHQEHSGKCLLCQTQEEEIHLDERVIYRNKDFVAFVPFWAIWPFEIWVVAKKHKKSLVDLNDRELTNLALAYQMITIKLDNLFKAPCPYSSSIYQAPVDGKDYPEMHFHLVFRPPVLRDTEVWKWMVGYEFMAQPQRDITPEQAAELLKATPNSHYSNS